MEVRGKVNRLTKFKPHVVIGQIHGGSDDVTVWRVEGKKLFITKGDDSHARKVTDDFELGAEYTIKFEVADGRCGTGSTAISSRSPCPAARPPAISRRASTCSPTPLPHRAS
jgi:hypothetical protein